MNISTTRSSQEGFTPNIDLNSRQALSKELTEHPNMAELINELKDMGCIIRRVGLRTLEITSDDADEVADFVTSRFNWQMEDDLYIEVVD